MSKILMKIDGSCFPNPGNMAIGIVIYKNGELLQQISETIGYGTNNIAEYKALIRGLEEIKKLNAERIDVYCDSQLVVKQLKGEYKVKNREILSLYNQVKRICQEIQGKIYFVWDRRENNYLADSLARRALFKEEIKKRENAAKELRVEKKESYFIVTKKNSKKFYQVNLNITHCDCPDFINKASKLKIECKHMLATKNFLQNEKKKIEIKNRGKMIVLVLSQMVKAKVWKETLEKLNQSTMYNIEFVIPEREDSEFLFEYLSKAEIVVGGLFKKEDLDRAKKLKLIQIPYAGVDKLDFNLIRKYPNIYVCNIHANSAAVAEHAFALVLALAKNVVSYDNELRMGKWHGFSTREPTIQLQGKSLGIIGLGSVGWEIAKRAKSFGMKIYAIKRRIKEIDFEKKQILEFLGEEGDLNTVIKKSDFIIIAVPLTSKTKALIGEKEFKLMRGKYLINIARGDIVKETALFESLKEHHLLGAAIDTWYQYPSSKDKEIQPSKYDFHKLDNVVMSPSISFEIRRKRLQYFVTMEEGDHHEISKGKDLNVEKSNW